MKVSTKGRYALRLMVDIAVNGGDGPVSVRDVARRQEISEKYLEQIISALGHAGYVQSVRGAQGGYVLTRRPSEYTAGMILRATEGSLAPVPCVGEEAAACEREGDCVTVILWKKINEAICGVVDGTTLQDMIDWKTEKLGDSQTQGD